MPPARILITTLRTTGEPDEFLAGTYRALTKFDGSLPCRDRELLGAFVF
jgi:hypothetical protein